MATNNDWKRALKHSEYWTWFTEWLLNFGGKAAWPVLIVTTLYMGAELYPGVNLPSGLNFAVFLAQLFALDMGGMGLVSMARQAKDDGNEEGAKQAGTFGKWLVGIVITSLVTVGIKQFLTAIPALAPFASGVDGIIMAVEFILVIARVVCAVLYGKVMHSLKPGESTPPALTPAIDVEALIAQALTDLQARFDTRLGEIVTEQTRMIAGLSASAEQRVQTAVQEVKNAAPVVDTQAIAEIVLTVLEPRVIGEMERFQSEIAQQYRSISPQPERELLPNTRYNHRQPETQQYGQGKQSNILPFHPETQETAQETENRRALVIRAYNEDTGRSDDDIVALTGVPKTTVWRYLKPFRDRAKTGEMPAISTIETA